MAVVDASLLSIEGDVVLPQHTNSICACEVLSVGLPAAPLLQLSLKNTTVGNILTLWDFTSIFDLDQTIIVGHNQQLIVTC